MTNYLERMEKLTGAGMTDYWTRIREDGDAFDREMLAREQAADTRRMEIEDAAEAQLAGMEAAAKGDPLVTQRIGAITVVVYGPNGFPFYGKHCKAPPVSGIPARGWVEWLTRPQALRVLASQIRRDRKASAKVLVSVAAARGTMTGPADGFQGRG